MFLSLAWLRDSLQKGKITHMNSQSQIYPTKMQQIATKRDNAWFILLNNSLLCGVHQPVSDVYYHTWVLTLNFPVSWSDFSIPRLTSHSRYTSKSKVAWVWCDKTTQFWERHSPVYKRQLIGNQWPGKSSNIKNKTKLITVSVKKTYIFSFWCVEGVWLQRRLPAVEMKIT